jgi:hypothetical protein
LLIGGLYNYFRGSWKGWIQANEIDVVKMTIFPALLFSSAAFMIAFAVIQPLYCSVNAQYFLNSLPALSVFLSLGLMPCEKNRTLKWTIIIAFGILFALVSLHILQIFIFQSLRIWI